MIRLAGRIFLSGLVVASAGGVIALGARVASFDRAQLVLADARRDGAPIQPFGFWRRPVSVERVLVDWVTKAGTASLARQAIAEEDSKFFKPAERLLDITGALQENPTSGRLWLTYSDLVWRMRLPPERVWPPLELAQLTARRDAEVMLLSSLQALRLWDTASSVQRDRAIANIAAMRRGVVGDRKTALVVAVQGRRDDERAEILSRLRDKLGKDQAWLKQVGL